MRHLSDDRGPTTEDRLANPGYPSSVVRRPSSVVCRPSSVVCLLDRLSFAETRLQQFEIVSDVGITGILRLCLQQRFARPAIVAAQHERIADVVEDFGRGTGYFHR